MWFFFKQKIQSIVISSVFGKWYQIISMIHTVNVTVLDRQTDGLTKLEWGIEMNQTFCERSLCFVSAGLLTRFTDWGGLWRAENFDDQFIKIQPSSDIHG